MVSLTEQTLADAFSFSMRSTEVVAGGKKICYVEMGSGPTVMLFHGATFGWPMWYELLATLSQTYRVVAVNLPGAPGTDRPEPGVAWDFEQDIVVPFTEFLSRYGGERPVLVGHSLGAWLCWKLALAAPEGVAGIFSIDALGFETNVPMPFRLAASPWIAHLLMATAMKGRQGLRRFLKSALSRKDALDERFVDCVAEAVTRTEALHPIWFMHLMFSGTTLNPSLDLRPVIKKMAVPARAIWGEEDPLINARVADEFLKKNMPQIKSFILPRVGHVAPIEAPRETLDQLFSFLPTCNF